MKFLNNVPDDWTAYWRRCRLCGERYHESEGHDCQLQRMEETAQEDDSNQTCHVCDDLDCSDNTSEAAREARLLEEPSK